MNRLFNQFLQKMMHKGSSPLVSINEAWNRRMSRESNEHHRLLLHPLDQVLVSAIDSETTGFHPELGDEILSLAAIHWKGGIMEQPYHSFIRIDGKIPDHISKLTGIYPDHLLDAPPIKEVLPVFLDYVGSCMLIGYYIGHDIKFINYFLWKHFRKRIQHRVLEVGKVVELLYPECKEASFDEVCSYMKVDNPARHTAIGDAQAVILLWAKLVEALKESGIENLLGLYEQLVRKHQ